MQMALSAFLIISIPALLIYALASIDPFLVVRRRMILYSLAWGIFVFFIADLIQTNEIANDTEVLVVSFGSAPLLEEFLKLSFLLFIYNRTLARYAGDGLVYGFAVGSGFAIAENIAYMLAETDVVIVRVVSTGLFHATLTAFVASLVCGVIYYKRWFIYPFFILLYGFAIIAHHMYNLTAFIAFAIEDAPELVIYTIFGLLFIVALQYFNRYRELRAIRTSMQDELTDTQNMVVRHGAQIITDFTKNAEQFGAEQPERLRAYLIDEIQIALLTHQVVKGHGRRRNIEKLRDDLNQLQQSADRARQALSDKVVNWLTEQQTRYEGT